MSDVMSPEEQKLADELYAGIMSYSGNSVRSQQAKDFRVGVSDLGFCSERTKRMLKQEHPDDTDMLTAFIGTALGDHVERAAAQTWDDATIQAEVEVVLPGDRGNTYTVRGHPDIVRTCGIVLDVKTRRGLWLAEKVGATQQQRFQRNLYGVGAFHAGMFDPAIRLRDVRVGNVWMDRAGDDKRLHVELEPLDLSVIDDAGRWLDEVINAYLTDTEAMKEPARQICEATCGFFEECRGGDLDVEGLITDPEHLAAIELNMEAMRMSRAANQMKDQAKAALEGVNGSTGEYLVSWTFVNGTVIPEQTRSGYSRLNIRKMKK